MTNKKAEQTPKNFTVKIECLVPTTISYTVKALTEQDALKEVDKITSQPKQIQHNVRRKIKLNAKVYNLGTSTLKLSKIYRQM